MVFAATVEPRRAPRPATATAMAMATRAAALCAALLAANAALTTAVLLPDAYMDEIFHVPQAQRFCSEDFFSYDPKLTTPPALYFFSYFILRVLPSMLGSSALECSTRNLRISQALISIALVPVAYWAIESTRRRGSSNIPLRSVTKREHELAGNHNDPQPTSGSESSASRLSRRNVARSEASSRPETKKDAGTFTAAAAQSHLATSLELSWIHAMIIATTAPLVFFSSFYYTDAGALLFLFATHAAFMQKRWILGSMLTLVSAAFRQTNMVWALVSLLISAEKMLIERGLWVPDFDCAGSVTGVISNLLCFARTVLRNLAAVVGSMLSLLFLISCSAAFLVWNDWGIALGDRTNHGFSLHFPQILYFSAFYLAVSGSVLVRPSMCASSFSSSLRPWISFSAIAKFIFFLVLANLFVWKFTYEHPFLLSDNRHFTFYIWRWTFRRFWWFRYAVTPVYVVSWALIWNRLYKSSGSVISSSAVVMAIVITLVPSPLIEPRYFIAGAAFVSLFLLSNPAGDAPTSEPSKKGRDVPRILPDWTSILALLVNSVLAVVPALVFALLPAGVDEHGRVQRFMW